jgi:glycosyltransferase involved in cell wall biosynthesis
MTVTIGIKALNEERRIATTLAAALEAVRPFQGEVILADSGSSDRTIEIARRFPVRTFQLADVSERSCGAGAQLAFQHASGTYFYLLDADMTLDPGFLPAAIEYLEAHPDVAGVGGMLREMNVDNQEFQIRANTARADLLPGIVDRLDGGGLYRAAAIGQAGYFADRNLHAFEEFDLATRLRFLGWRLARIHVPAVNHYGHTMGGYALLWRRVTSGYVRATGEVLRAAIGRPHLPLVLGGLGHIRHAALVIGWWAFMIGSVVGHAPAALLSVTLVAPLPWLWFRRGSLRLALFSFVSWNVSACGLVTGVWGRRLPPEQTIASVEIS